MPCVGNQPSPATILVVEDSALQAAALKRVLASAGYTVYVAGNGVIGLDIARELKPSLIISDIMMPEMDGFELCERIKNDVSLQGTPVILLTSLTDPKDVIKGLECHADYFLTKPYNPDYLLSRIKFIQFSHTLKDTDSDESGVQIYFAGHKYQIHADRRQVLSLLLSIYETAVHNNTELLETQNKLKLLNHELEKRVEERTSALTNEIEERKRVEEEIRDLNTNLEKRVHERTSQLEALNAELALARDTAETATRAKSNFLATMSHEIRTPMNAIIGMCHLALQTELTAKQQNYLTKISTASHSLLHIINDTLDFSKIEAGKLALDPIPFRLQELLDTLISVTETKIEDKGLEFVFDVDPCIPQGLVGDSLRLGQILLNLLSNAIKFTETGEIVLSISLVEQQEQRIKLFFSVRDTGIGLTQEQIGLIFKPFSQADSSTTRKFGGTGLGLSIVNRLVQMMGGSVAVESEFGAGATFSFTAWLETSAEPEVITTECSVSLKGLRVLVIDDNAAARQIFTEMLESFGCKVDSAESGEKGLADLEYAWKQDTPYRLLLLDWRMKGMDGVQVSQRIREDARFSKLLNIIMVTAGARDELLQATNGMALNSILIKPVTPSTMLETLFSCLGGKQVIRNSLEQLPSDESVKNSLAGVRILLVEDNEMNQEVALELLENVGVSVRIADNGQEALDILQTEQFDGVLMDVQMPVMDGYQATYEIRRQERFRYLPVIAMTANALAGDREKCLAAGMNDHISKPINVKEMFATLIRWVRPTHGTETVAPLLSNSSLSNEQEPLPELAGIDVAAAVSSLNGNIVLYRKMINRFYQSNQDFAQSFETALTNGDVESATRSAHTLKGLSGSIGARRLQKTAEKLEAACGDGLKQAILNRLASVAKELDTVLATLADSADVTITEPQNTAEAHSTIPALPDTLVHDLRTAAEHLDKSALLALLDSLQKSEPEFAAELKSLAESYRFDLIEKKLSGAGNESAT